MLWEEENSHNPTALDGKTQRRVQENTRSGQAMRKLAQRLLPIMLVVVLALEISQPSPAAASSPAKTRPFEMTLKDGKLTARIRATPLRSVITELSRLTGAEVHWLSQEKEDVISRDFNDVPLHDVFESILKKNYMLSYVSVGNEQKLACVWITSEQMMRVSLPAAGAASGLSTTEEELTRRASDPTVPGENLTGNVEEQERRRDSVSGNRIGEKDKNEEARTAPSQPASNPTNAIPVVVPVEFGGIRPEIRVVVAGSETTKSFAVIDLTTPAKPRLRKFDPKFDSGSRMAISGSNVVAGSVVSGDVQLIDVSNPAEPALTGKISTTLVAVGAIAVRGNIVAVGERVKTPDARVAFIDFSSPMKPFFITMARTSLRGINSIAFTEDRVVLAAGPADTQVWQIDFTKEQPRLTEFPVNISGSPLIAADADANRVAAGGLGTHGSLLKLFDPISREPIGTADIPLPYITSLAISDSLVFAGSAQSSALVNFTRSTVTLKTDLGGCTAAIEGIIAACGDPEGSHVKLFDLTSDPPTPIGDIDSGIDAISTLAISTFR